MSTVIPSTAFRWDKQAGQFWQEVSTLAHQYQFTGTSIALGSRYDDRVIHFRMDRVDRDGEGEIVAWHFSPYLPGDGSRAPFDILIIND
jgi:hypothetical protein